MEHKKRFKSSHLENSLSKTDQLIIPMIEVSLPTPIPSPQRNEIQVQNFDPNHLNQSEVNKKIPCGDIQPKPHAQRNLIGLCNNSR